jgi:adenine specific DNA methylase Mod
MAMRERVLRQRGSIYVHVDHHAAHHVRLVLDEVFGEHRFLNEIIWAYSGGGVPKNRFCILPEK